jgi:hypothetical protein
VDKARELEEVKVSPSPIHRVMDRPIVKASPSLKVHMYMNLTFE